MLVALPPFFGLSLIAGTGCAGYSSPMARNSVSESQGEHKLAIAGELVDDIELGRLTPENLLLKAGKACSPCFK